MNPGDNQTQKPTTVEPAVEVVGGDVSKPKNPEKPSFFKRRPVLLAAAALFIVGIGIGVFIARKDKVEVAENQNQSLKLGVVPAIIDGTATYKSSSESWQQLTAETELKEGDWVSAETGGRLVLVFDDGSAIRLDSSTIVQLSSLSVNNVQINQSSGVVYSRVVESDRNFTIKVDETDFTALGTAFTTHNTESKQGVQVVQSSVKVTGLNEEINEGKQYFKSHTNKELVDKTTDISLEEIKSDSFMIWNLELDQKDENFKDKLGYFNKIKDKLPEVEETDENETAITITARNNDKGTVLSWTVSGIDYSDGFKVVRSHKTSNPTYGRDDSQLVGKDARSFTWKGDRNKKEYWYRVCAYRPSQNSCVSYSNAVKISSVYIEPPKVKRGVMSLTENSGLLSWNYTGKAIYGYKVVISTDSDPTYPENEYVYFGSKNSFVLDLSKKPDGTYYVRVCAYTDGTESSKCVDYSNNVVITKP